MKTTRRNKVGVCLRLALLLAIASVARGQNDVVAVQSQPEDPMPVQDALDHVGGAPAVTPTFESAYPYTVSLRRRSNMGYFCAGVLIGSRHVLTAAHCVDSSRTSADSKPLVVVGSASSTKTSGPGVQVIPTSRVIFHPDFQSRRFPDLAILELSSAANQIPVQIPTSTTYSPENGQVLNSLGWGQRSSRSGHSETIQVASVEHMRPKTCRNRLGKKMIFFYQICMGGDGAGSCAGDNGGPIVQTGSNIADDVLVGIMGPNHVCGKSLRPDVHVRVAPFIDWIKEISGNS